MVSKTTKQNKRLFCYDFFLFWQVRVEEEPQKGALFYNLSIKYNELMASAQARVPAEFKHINKRRKRN